MEYMLLIMEPAGAAARTRRSRRPPNARADAAFRQTRSARAACSCRVSRCVPTTPAFACRFATANRHSSTVRSPKRRRWWAGSSCSTATRAKQAIAVARECPAAEWATVEVREFGPCYASIRADAGRGRRAADPSNGRSGVAHGVGAHHRRPRAHSARRRTRGRVRAGRAGRGVGAMAGAWRARSIPPRG